MSYCSDPKCQCKNCREARAKKAAAVPKVMIQHRHRPVTQQYVNPNALCPCGSNSKAKHCCLSKLTMVQSIVPGLVKKKPIAKAGDGTTAVTS
jgi:hypothetical protein